MSVCLPLSVGVGLLFSAVLSVPAEFVSDRQPCFVSSVIGLCVVNRRFVPDPVQSALFAPPPPLCVPDIVSFTHLSG